ARAVQARAEERLRPRRSARDRDRGCGSRPVWVSFLPGGDPRILGPQPDRSAHGRGDGEFEAEAQATPRRDVRVDLRGYGARVRPPEAVAGDQPDARARGRPAPNCGVRLDSIGSAVVMAMLSFLFGASLVILVALTVIAGM